MARFFLHLHVAQLIIGERGLPEPPWRYTDAHQMALSIVETLGRTARSIKPPWRKLWQALRHPRGQGLLCIVRLRGINDGEDHER